MAERRHFAGRLVTLAVAGAAFCAVAMPVTPANAQIDLSQVYLGWDFGNGFGIGVGPVPSAYNPCPTYGWPFYPSHCVARWPMVR
jgi:hypothetical protein